jgi:hypothetical protein
MFLARMSRSGPLCVLFTDVARFAGGRGLSFFGQL